MANIPPVIPPQPPPTLHLHMDADRDGVVDNNPAGTESHTWIWGNDGPGAVLLSNNDDDLAQNVIDNHDGVVDGNNDIQDLVPFEIRRDPPGTPFPVGWYAILRVAEPERIRIFDAGQAVVIDPMNDSYEIDDLSQPVIGFLAEATQYADADWDGYNEVFLELYDQDDNLQVTRTAIVRVAPWIIASHLVQPVQVYVVNDDGNNMQFRTDLGNILGPLGIPLVQGPVSHDIWMQDCMELGQSTIPTGTTLAAVVQSPRQRGLDGFPRTLLAPDLGYDRPGAVAPLADTTYDSSGNLEVTPPLTDHDGVNYPFGRIYYCDGDGVDHVSPNFVRFLEAQEVQNPLEVNSSFFLVGHVDELMSFVPAPPTVDGNVQSSQGFKLLLASPRLAYSILDQMVMNGNGNAIMRPGRMDHAGNNLQTTVAMMLAEMRPDPLGVGPNITLRQFNLGPAPGFVSIQEEIDRVLAQLIRRLGLAIPAGDPLLAVAAAAGCPQAVLDLAQAASANAGGVSDIIEVPFVVEPAQGAPNLADGYTVDMVNMVVLNNDCIVPMAFGPVDPVSNMDLFEQSLFNALTAIGLNVDWIDTWDPYHLGKGGAHCGTNTLRNTANYNWWTYPQGVNR